MVYVYIYIYLYGYGYMWAPIIDETRAPLTIRNCCVMCCFWIIVVPRTVCWHNAYYLPCDCWWSAHLVALRLDRWSDPLPRTIPRGSTWRDLEHLWRLVSAQRCARPNSATTVFHNFSERWEIPWYPSEGHVGCSCKICNFFMAALMRTVLSDATETPQLLWIAGVCWALEEMENLMVSGGPLVVWVFRHRGGLELAASKG